MNQSAVKEISAQYLAESQASPESLITEHLDLWTSATSRKNTTGRGSSQKYELYGIKKLRELILGLALSGKLCDSLTNLGYDFDEKLSKERASYSKRNKRKLKGYKIGVPVLTEFTIPDGWRWMRVSELCDLLTGATPSRQNPEYFGGGIKWLVSGDINRGIIFDCKGRITDEGLSSSNCKILPENTVLIALNGQGKTRASVALLKTPAACNQSLVGMIPIDSRILDSQYLLWSLRYRYIEIRDITGQNQRRGLNMGLVAELSIPLPPVEEQHRIVTKVDELMTLCDQLENQTEQNLDAHATLADTLLDALTRAQNAAELAENWQRLEANWDTLFPTTLAGERAIDKLKQTILQLAVMGKLVPQDPTDEPASELLKRIAAEKEQLVKDKKTKKQKPLPPITDEEEPFELPKGWEWCRFFDVNTVKSELVSAVDYPSERQIAPDSIEKGTGKLLFERTVSEIGAKGPNNRFYSGQILYSKIRPSLNKVTIAPYDGLCSADMYPVICHSCSAYMLKYMLSEPFLQQVRLAENRVKMPKLNLESLGMFLVPLPPLKVQEQIVLRLEELMTLCDQLKQRLQTAQQTQQKFTDAVVSTTVTGTV